MDVTLADMLDARERRAERQRALLAHYGVPLICFTMNIAGPVKNSPLIRRGFDRGNTLLRRALARERLVPLETVLTRESTGNEALYAVDTEPERLKRLTAELEEHTPAGRLFDMDVLDRDGAKLDRSCLDLPPRPCLICGKPAAGCARSRAHSLEALQRETVRILEETLADADADSAAALACRALLYEAGTTPKPGLVDRSNNGSHSDMDLFTFMGSAAALWPYFRKCVRIGMDAAARPARESLPLLRTAGKLAEGDMLAATGGVNTHKGAIFSMGLVCAALGRLPREMWRRPDLVLSQCAAIAEGITARELDGLAGPDAATAGQRFFAQYGVTGVRGQAEAGFPAVLTAGLPALERGIAGGYGLDRAGCAALLAILSSTDDTNMISRGGRETQQAVSRETAALLRRDPFPGLGTLRQLDESFIRRGLSPGGSADLLAICYLLYFLKHEEED